MLTPEDIQELRPKFEEIQQMLSVALIESEADMSDDACGGFILVVGLMEQLAAEVAEKQGHSVKEALERVASTAHLEETKGEGEPNWRFGREAGTADEDGQGVKEALKQVGNRANSAEGAGVLGAVTGAAASLSFTGLGGFGVVGGGSAIGLGGLAGAGVATGGVGLAGAAALYLAYKGGAAALESELGQKAFDQAGVAGRKAVGQAGVAGRKAAEQAGVAGRKAAEQVEEAGRNTAERARAVGKKAAGGLGKLRNVRKRSDSQKDEPSGDEPSVVG